MPKKYRRSMVGKRVTAFGFIGLLLASILSSLTFSVNPVSAAPNEWINRGTIVYNDKTYTLSSRKAGDREVFTTTTESCTFNGNSDYKERYYDALLVSKDGRSVIWSEVDRDNVNTGGNVNCVTKDTPIALGSPEGRHTWFYQKDSVIYAYHGRATFTEAPTKVNGATIYTTSGGDCQDILVKEASGRWLFFPMATKTTMESAFPPGRTAKSENYNDFMKITASAPDFCKVASQKMVLQYLFTDSVQTREERIHDNYDVCGQNDSSEGLGKKIPAWIGTVTEASPDIRINDLVIHCFFQEVPWWDSDWGVIGQDDYLLIVPQCYNEARSDCSDTTNGVIKMNTADFALLGWDDGYIITQGVTSKIPSLAGPPIDLDDPGSGGDPNCAAANEKLGWIMCPAIESLGKIIVGLDNTVLCLLKINTAKIFNDNTGSTGCAGFGLSAATQSSSSAYRIAWGVFRNFALALLVIIALVMVASQILGLEIFDAYTIRKMLPRLIVAVILLSLSWNLMQFLFTMSNSAADAIRTLIWTPFQHLDPTRNLNTTTSVIAGIIGTAAAPVGILAGVTYAGVLGIGGILSLAGTIFLFVFSAWILLVARDVVATMLIIAAPVAIICAAFEPFDKVFSAWRGLLTTILLSVPIIAAIIQISHVGALISMESDNIFAAIAILIAGYALIWITFKKLDTVAGQLGNVVGNVTGRAQKALSDYRGESAKRRLNEAVEGRRNIGGRFGTGWLANRGVGLVRRAKLSGDVGAGAFGFGSTGRAKYREAVRTMQAGVSAKMMDQDKDRAGGDDDAMRLLSRRGMNNNRFLREYADIQRRRNPEISQEEATQRARTALGLSESSLGANVGTSAMRVAAQKSLLKSNTSYRRQLVQQTDGSWRDEDMDFGQMSKTMYGDVSELVQDGLITVADGAAMIKSNGARADRAGVGFGSAMGHLERVVTHGTGELDREIDTGDNAGLTHLETMANEVLVGTGPGQLIGQRHEAVRILAPEMIRRAREAAVRDIGPDGAPTLNRDFIEQAAMAARYQDLGQQLPEMNAELNANGFLGERLDPENNNSPTMLQVIEFMRTPPGQNQNNLLYRQIFEAERNRVEDEARTRGSIPVGPISPADMARIEETARQATGRRIQDAQRVFLEYRREYNTGYQANQPPEPGAPVGGIPGL